MLIKSNYAEKRKSQYMCDSCEKIIVKTERVSIYRCTSVNDKVLKKYDLCRDCWRKIRIIVEKHKLKREV